jgi:hypothetical protein|tara:strand:- start:11 stop:442 length:432 start_codon:yes stop_codon:yes gene_type:complete
MIMDWTIVINRKEYPEMPDEVFNEYHDNFLKAMSVCKKLAEEDSEFPYANIHLDNGWSSEDRLWFRLYIAIKTKNYECIGKWGGWYMPCPDMVASNLYEGGAIYWGELLEFRYHYHSQRYTEREQEFDCNLTPVQQRILRETA